MENCSNSCYIDSVIFALFHRDIQGYEGLLSQDLSHNETASEMQRFLRDNIVVPLRRGNIVPGHDMVSKADYWHVCELCGQRDEDLLCVF